MNKDLKEYIKNKFLYVNLKNINNNDPKSAIIVEHENSDDIYNLINLNDQITVSDIDGNLQNIDRLNLSFKNSFFRLNDNINKISNINNNNIEFIDKNNNNNTMSFDEFNKNILNKHRKELIGGGNNVNTIDDIYKNFNDSYVNYQNGGLYDKVHNFVSNEVMDMKQGFRKFFPAGTELNTYANDIQTLVNHDLIKNDDFKKPEVVKHFISDQGKLHERFEEFKKLKLEKKGMFGMSAPDHAGVKKAKHVLEEWRNFFTIYLITLEMMTFSASILKPLIKKNYDYIKNWGGNKMHTVIRYLHHELCNHKVYFDLGKDFEHECNKEWSKECDTTINTSKKSHAEKLNQFKTDHSCLRACQKKTFFGYPQYCKEFNIHYKPHIPKEIQESNVSAGNDLPKVGVHLNQESVDSNDKIHNPHHIEVKVEEHPVLNTNAADNIPVVHGAVPITNNQVPPPPPYPGKN